MTFWAYPFIAGSVGYFLLGLFFLTGQKNKFQKLYGVLCLTTSLWQMTWSVLFAGVESEWTLFYVRACYTGVVFIPAVMLQFIAEFLGRTTEVKAVKFAYLSSSVLAISVWCGPLFVRGLNTFSWGRAAQGGWLHPVFGLMVVLVVGRVWVLLKDKLLIAELAAPKKKQIRWVLIATLMYCGGACDLLSNYGISFVPLSPFFLGVAFVLYSYAMARLEFLSVPLSPQSEKEFKRREAASLEMNQMQMSAAFPLVSQGELLGYLLLGEKKSEESYSKEDLLLLRIVANQAALGYQRVRYLEMAVHGARTEMLGEIAGGFAHEIKTPLANISLPAELSLLDLDDLKAGRKTLDEVVPELQARMKDIMSQAFKASEKIEAVRQFSKPGQVHLEAVQLSQVLENSLGLLSHLLTKTGTIVRADFTPHLPAVRADAKQLEIVFVNLIKNAAEAMATHSSSALARELRLSARDDGDWVIISVKDSGPGIKRTDVGHLFEAYFTTKGSTGTGMGLFLSQQVVKAHGGSIVVNTTEGQGTEFVIRLPKAKNSDALPTSSEDSSRSVAAPESVVRSTGTAVANEEASAA